MRFDETRMRQPFFERAQDRIEALDVTDLQNELPLRGQLRQLAGLRRVFRDRFFDQQMFPLLQKRLRDREMRIGGRRDRGGVDQVGKFVERIRRPNLVLLCHLRGDRGIGVVDGGEIGRVRLGVKPGMIFPDVADADDSDSQIFHGRVRLENVE